MNKKIKRYLEEIDKTENKMKELDAYLKGVKAALKAEEETEMIKTIRSMKLESHELFELLNGIQNGDVVFQHNEESDSDEEEGSFVVKEDISDEMEDETYDELEENE